VGGFHFFWNFHPEPWGKIDFHFDVNIFSDGVGEKPPTMILLMNSQRGDMGHGSEN